MCRAPKGLVKTTSKTTVPKLPPAMLRRSAVAGQSARRGQSGPPGVARRGAVRPRGVGRKRLDNVASPAGYGAGRGTGRVIGSGTGFATIPTVPGRHLLLSLAYTVNNR